MTVKINTWKCIMIRSIEIKGTMLGLMIPSLMWGLVLEEAGLVVIEAESQDVSQYFILESSEDGFLGSGYLRAQTDSFNSGGKGTIEYPFLINTAGTYQLAMRSRIGHGDSNTESNDTFFRLVHDDGVAITPEPNDNTPHSGGWHKVYMNTGGKWSNDASNHDNNPRSVSWNLQSGQRYALQISARSKDHLLDRIILWDRSAYSLANKATGKQANNAEFDALFPSPVQESQAWNGWPVDPSGYVDTGSWIGWIYIADDPWIWVEAWHGYSYLAPETLTANGAWLFTPARLK